jgi:hypothetical protein|tara:strand:- start:259 stop:2655 length:2397 start_codon:yes stop_codon:yes gene_type:complete
MRDFPSQVVSDIEKLSYEYGLKVAQAIEHEWFDNTNNLNRHVYNKQNFHNLRLYARGEQSVQKYKDELSINGDLSYLNLDWKPVPIIPKFVDIVVNGMANRTYDIKSYSQDPNGVARRTEYMNSIMEDMRSRELKNFIKEEFGMDLFKNPPNLLPETQEELDLHMQLTYKQGIEIAEEQAINTLLEGSDYELIKKRFYYDLTVLGIGAVKTSFNTSEGVKVEYVDPGSLVYSHTESPYFDDIYYVGEVKSIPINELLKEFPHLSTDDLKEATRHSNQSFARNNSVSSKNKNSDNNKVQVLYFNYKTFMNEVYKLKETSSGGEKAIEKDDTFNPEENQNFTKKSRSVECLYDGAIILGTEQLIRWEMSKNMMRSKSNFNKVKMNYAICAPRMYEGRIESLVSRITGFADMIQLTHLKLQQVMSRITPDGVYLDADGLAEVDLGNGTNYNPQEALNMFFQTGSVIGRSFTSEGDMNPGKVPIQEISSGNGGAKMQSLIGNYNYYLQMIRDTTGLNEARDAAQPDPKALVGVQKMAAANSNTATRHILQGGLYITKQVAECVSLRISDILEYSPTADAFVQSLGYHNVSTLSEMSELHLYDFGIFIELTPDEEEKQMLENNIQVALAQQNIELEDAIDLREIKNIKLANQLLKIRRKKKLQRDQEIQQQNIQAQSQANIQAQQAAAQSEMQKQQSIAQTSIALEQSKNEMEIQKLYQEAEIKKQLMELEFQFNMQLKGIEVDGQRSKETEKEDRKDKRTKIQATQQSELIEQRQNEGPSKDFESSGNDILGGIDMSMFGPR